MAVRGVVTTLEFYPEDWEAGDTSLYRFQNHFEGTRTFNGEVYTHNFFQVSGLVKMRDTSGLGAQINFAATAANVDLVEAAILGRYFCAITVWRWSSTEGLDNPSSFNVFAGQGGACDTADNDSTTVNLIIKDYAQTTRPDFPWRKIPWTITGPLSFRR